MIKIPLSMAVALNLYFRQRWIRLWRKLSSSARHVKINLRGSPRPKWPDSPTSLIINRTPKFMNKFIWPTVIVVIVALGAWAYYARHEQQNQPAQNMSVENLQNIQPPSSSTAATLTEMQISSPVFGDNQTIPEQYTCDGKSLSIPLAFSGVPKEAKSLALIMDDPDVPKSLIPNGLFVHWVVFNMPATTTMLSENKIPPGVQGDNGSSKLGYTGPCPPDREHRYFFNLYALDSMLSLPSGSTKDQLETAMSGHILTSAQLIGLYDKKGNAK